MDLLTINTIILDPERYGTAGRKLNVIGRDRQQDQLYRGSSLRNFCALYNARYPSRLTLNSHTIRHHIRRYGKWYNLEISLRYDDGSHWSELFKDAEEFDRVDTARPYHGSPCILISVKDLTKKVTFSSISGLSRTMNFNPGDVFHMIRKYHYHVSACGRWVTTLPKYLPETIRILTSARVIWSPLSNVPRMLSLKDIALYEETSRMLRFILTGRPGSTTTNHAGEFRLLS